MCPVVYMPRVAHSKNFRQQSPLEMDYNFELKADTVRDYSVDETIQTQVLH